MRIVTAHATEAGHRINEDRLLVRTEHDATVLVVADGAGGTGNGALAANTIVELIQRCEMRVVQDENACVCTLQDLDLHMTRACRGGEAAAAIVVVRSDRIFGASAGDCECWLVKNDDVDVLTKHQIRKPLLGSGTAQPVGFDRDVSAGTLLVGSDGLFKYAKRSSIANAARSVDIEQAKRELGNVARLPNGALQDDVSFIVCKRLP